MKTKKTSLLFLTGIIVLIALEVTTADVLGVCNGPNFWGMQYPGTVNQTNRYRHPAKPSDYEFGARLTSDNYDGSHYGTHDWLADASLRSLVDVVKNPLFFLDWNWIYPHEILLNEWPSWKENYGNIVGTHEVERSYISYLYATQMPDTKIAPYLTIQQEGVTIKDLGKRKMWIGQKTKHVFQFDYKISDGVYGFMPIFTPNINKVKFLSEEAIKCIGKNQSDNKNRLKSVMQPEGAAIWLGAMTHFIADMISPAHLLKAKPNKHIYSSSYYHNWFENNLASVTKWDKSNNAGGGPEQRIFSWDYRKATIAPIIPIEPGLATTLMAVTTINVAFRTDGNHQYIPLNNNNHNESYNSGLFINETKLNPDIYWDWKQDLNNYGRLNSNHRYFYDKVEYLLCWATYFTACAMQYCYNEGKKRSETDILNPDNYVRNPAPATPPKERAEPDPQSKIDEFLRNITPLERVSRNLKNIGDLLRTFALAGISYVLRTLFETMR